MKIQLRLFLIIGFIFTATLSFAQQKLTSGEYTIAISDVTSMGSDYEGNYSIHKKGVKVASQKFSVMILKTTASINIKESEQFGDTVTYFYDSKKFDCMDEIKKVNGYKDIKDIILNGILFYAELRFRDN